MKIMLKDVLKEMRERKQLKQSEVAEHVGVTAQTYMKWENGKNEPKASDIKKLAEILCVSESEICRGQKFDSDISEIQFMKKTASIMKELDEVTFTSILFEFITDKKGFMEKLEKERPTNEMLLEKYMREKEKAEELAEYMEAHGQEMAELQEKEKEEILFGLENEQ
ncbi:XRE family transcriptional regulator [Vibrio metoecus]|uniref:helix-turn-helix transcriptional regulator n=1 Tax=Vibrio metoecus TaxID=1481663 RepID=UPI0006D7B8E9|nr:helix-turn-helix transcriptional regulator [Vibrio metoecus]KQA97642.1 XRE family transcriptional regulator [Vibrio metoecus]PAR53846.1 XRE family transcriptional regulator [Vibrio metoecus]PAR59519.1 XRE family transcriptional regulator [Vibrio metoecus]